MDSPPASSRSPIAALREGLRRQMPACRHWAYLDNAAVAPLPQPAADAIGEMAAAFAEHGDTDWPALNRRAQRCRTLAADLIGADETEIALVPNTTHGLSLVAEGYPWEPGDNVVTLANEFPSNQYPWLNLVSRGVEVRRVGVDGVVVDRSRLADACDSRTRIVAVSWVGYATGFRADPAALAEVAHQAGALLCLDAIQGLGVFPMDVKAAGVDFLAADGHKWLLGPEGAGVFYIRRDLLDRLRVFGAGWHSVKAGHDFSTIEFDLRDDAARFEGGSLNLIGFAGLAASLEILSRAGLSHDRSPIADAVLDLGEYACQRLKRIGATVFSDRTPTHASGIVSFLPRDGEPAVWASRLKAAGVAVAARNGWLRASMHGYNDESDIDRLIETLKKG